MKTSVRGKMPVASTKLKEKLFVFNFGEKENIYILILYFKKKLYFKSFFGCSSVFGLILAVKGHTNTITHKIPPS